MFLAALSKSRLAGLGLFSLLIALLNALSAHHPVVGLACAVGFLVSTGSLFGGRWVKAERSIQVLLGMLAVVCMLALGGSVLYYADATSLVWLFFLCLGVYALALLFGKQGEHEKEESRTIPWTFLIVFVLGLAAWWSVILPIDIVEPVRSPWDVIDPLAIMAILIAGTAYLFLIRSTTRIALWSTVSLFFSLIGLAAVVYPLGYGFDPFIHRATVAHILEFGSIEPKPLYYAGQYALELIGARLFSVPIQVLDVYLAPVCASLFLSAAAFFGFAPLKERRRISLANLFFLPLAVFVSTTPQALAYTLTACLVLLSLPRITNHTTTPGLPVLFLLAGAALATHPLAGIPAAVYLLLVLVWDKQRHRGLQIASTVLLAVGGVLIIPIVFVIQAQQADLNIVFSLSQLSWDQLQLTGFFANRYSLVFDALYLIIDNQLWILIALAAISFAYRKHLPWSVHLPVLAAGMWLLTYFILTLTLQFDFLIEYERTTYAERLLTLTMIFLVPSAGLAISGLWHRASVKNVAPRVVLAALLVMMIGAGTYGAYPRHDNYARSAGFNVGESDIDAVYAIADAGGDEDFIVLANQAVSAAALQEFGFKVYYKGDIFYYPIPTGNELYHSYLEMADNEPTREVMEEAMDFAGVDLGFFVLNDYWWQSTRIREHAKQQADDWFTIGDGAISVFRFERSAN